MPVLTAVCALVALSAPARLSSYADVKRHLMAGGDVRVVIEYKKTSLTVEGKEEPAPDAVGGMTLDAYETFAKGVVRNEKEYLATSHTALIGHPRHGHVYNYVRLRLYEDGSAELTARYLKPTTFEIVMDETFRGRLSDGKDGHGVHMFAR